VTTFSLIPNSVLISFLTITVAVALVGRIQVSIRSLYRRKRSGKITLILHGERYPKYHSSLIDREELQNRPNGEKIGPCDEYTVRQRTRHRNNTTVQKAFPKEVYTQHLEMPSLYADYNDNIDGIDVFDHLRSTNPMHRRQYLGGWRALFNFLMTVPLVNSYLLSGFRSTVPPLSQSEFQRQLIVKLLGFGENLLR